MKSLRFRIQQALTFLIMLGVVLVVARAAGWFLAWSNSGRPREMSALPDRLLSEHGKGVLIGTFVLVVVFTVGSIAVDGAKKRKRRRLIEGHGDHDAMAAYLEWRELDVIEQEKRLSTMTHDDRRRHKAAEVRYHGGRAS